MEDKKHQTVRKKWCAYTDWIKSGLQVKHWMFLLLLGVGLLCLGTFFLSATTPFSLLHLHKPTLYWLSPSRLAYLSLLIGASSLGSGLWQLKRALSTPFTADGTRPYQQHKQGARIAVIGGGHGQATILRGLKNYTRNLTAIVTVADDGGSSGRLRREMGILPPGDFRNCIAALADDEALTTRVFQYRFRTNAGLDGHSFGNLFISAMFGVTGSFEDALLESSRVLAVQGRVVPSTLEAVQLAADIQQATGAVTRVRGESQIPQAHGDILRVCLEPISPPAYPGAVQAILNAEMVIVGPGSLYTSILPNLLVPEITKAIRASRALKVYICNLATQPGETDGYTAERHLETLTAHLGANLFDVIVLNNKFSIGKLPENADWIRPEIKHQPGLRSIQTDLTSAQTTWQHDSQKLAQSIMELLP
ncbi:MAG: YvcK family protein [Chloroflexota bacterium]|nr:YvcK family protein [Chloroflexota bacterium]